MSAAPHATGAVVGWPRTWLRLEGLAGLVAGVAGYHAAGGDWLWLVPALLAVDVSMAGYLAGSHPGAIVYNLFHNWFTALAVLGLGLVVAVPAAQLAGWILIAHVGGDRLAGYGLKYASAFGDTHLGWIGRRARDGRTSGTGADLPE
jgi:Domain of unknown function (DUF4260)